MDRIPPRRRAPGARRRADHGDVRTAPGGACAGRAGLVSHVGQPGPGLPVPGPPGANRPVRRHHARRRRRRLVGGALDPVARRSRRRGAPAPGGLRADRQGPEPKRRTTRVQVDPQALADAPVPVGGGADDARHAPRRRTGDAPARHRLVVDPAHRRHHGRRLRPGAGGDGRRLQPGGQRPGCGACRRAGLRPEPEPVAARADGRRGTAPERRRPGKRLPDRAGEPAARRLRFIHRRRPRVHIHGGRLATAPRPTDGSLLALAVYERVVRAPTAAGAAKLNQAVVTAGDAPWTIPQYKAIDSAMFQLANTIEPGAATNAKATGGTGPPVRTSWRWTSSSTRRWPPGPSTKR